MHHADSLVDHTDDISASCACWEVAAFTTDFSRDWLIEQDDSRQSWGASGWCFYYSCAEGCQRGETKR